MTIMNTLYQTMLAYIQENAADIIFWLVLFVLILVLYTLYLARRITCESSKRAIEVAEASERKAEDIGRRIEELNHYLRDVFSKEFGGAMEAFDSTVSSVLHEMKEELHQSVSNIERIESAVQGRRKIDLRVEEGCDKAQALLENKPTA